MNRILFFLIFSGLPLPLFAQREMFVSVDPSTAEITKKSVIIEDTTWLPSASSAFNEKEQLFYFFAFRDDEPQLSIYTIDAVTGKKKANTPLQSLSNGTSPFNLKYSEKLERIIGISRDTVNLQFRIVSINPFNGSNKTLPYVCNTITLYNNTINNNNDTYTFFGQDSTDIERLYTIDLNNENILYSPAIDSAESINIYDIQYDRVSDKYYCIIIKNTIPRSCHLATIDIITGKYDIREPIKDYHGYVVLGMTAYSSKHHKYSIGIADTPSPGKPSEAKYYTINSTTGELLSSPYILQPSGILTKDNLVFLTYNDAQNELVGLHWEANSKIDVNKIDIYPIPFRNELYIDLHQLSTTVYITMYNALNQLVQKNAYYNTSRITIHRGSLGPGLYLLNIYDTNGQLILNKKVIAF